MQLTPPYPAYIQTSVKYHEWAALLHISFSNIGRSKLKRPIQTGKDIESHISSFFVPSQAIFFLQGKTLKLKCLHISEDNISRFKRFKVHFCKSGV